MLVDEAKIYVRSGDGGAGVVAFRREKYVPMGGPSGGDGGNGGDVIIRVNSSINTLFYFKRRNRFEAKKGAKGASSNMTGANAPHLVIDVPRGTVVRDAQTGELLADLLAEGDSVIVAKGGRGGKGNSRFVSSSNRAPRMAEKGAPGEERWISLELKLLADVGIVGVPNAGKSTLLSVVSNAKPKIAPYPFTTLEPNLGVVILNHHDLVWADIPGLIEGAHLGVGLGHAFLRHIQRTRVLVHLLDGSADDPLADYNQINAELALYDERLSRKPQVVVLNKIDLPEVQERLPDLQIAFYQRGITLMTISAATRQNVDTLVERVFQEVSRLPAEQEPIHQKPVYELPEDENAFTVERDRAGHYIVRGKAIERAAKMTYWDYEESLMRFQRILDALGISKALEEAGVQVGDTVFIGEHELEWSE